MNEVRLIDAEALKETIISICGNCSNIIREYKNGIPDGNCAIQPIMNMIDNAPTVEQKYYERIVAQINPVIEARPQGKWEYNQYDGNPNIGNWHCSECRHIVFGGYSQKPYYNFCPNCGCDMRKPNCVTCDHFGDCDGCEKGEEE